MLNSPTITTIPKTALKTVDKKLLFILLILVLTLITPYASSSPDGLESVAESFGFNEDVGIVLFLEDYGIENINNNFL